MGFRWRLYSQDERGSFILKKYLSVKNISSIAVLGALGAVLMLFDFPISFIAPSFYKLDLGDLPCLIGAFALGPVPALFIQIVKIIVKLLLKPTSTAFVGEIAAFCFSTVFCVSAALIYQRDKTRKGAIKAMIIATIVMALAAVVVVWGAYVGIKIAIAHRNEEKINARDMVKNLIIGIVIIFVVAMGAPLLINGLAAWVGVGA